MRNKYLDMKRTKDYARGRDGGHEYYPRMKRHMMEQEQMEMRDGRNPYGSAGGYVRDHRMSRDNARGRNDYNMDYRDNIGNDYNDYNDYRQDDYARYGSRYDYTGNSRYDGDMRYDNDYAKNDYNDYGQAEKEYKHKLKEWKERLKQKDRFRVNEEQIIRMAKNMNIDFKDFDEDEFYITYLMMVSDYPKTSNDYNQYIQMAKEWLMDDDVAMKGSDKLCAYLYEIVLDDKEQFIR